MAIRLDATFKVNLRVAEVLALVNKESMDATDRGLQLIEKQAKILSPYETGTNRRSIEHEVIATASGPQGSVYTTSGYGGYLEVGTGQRRSGTEQKLNLKGTGGPTRFMFPAFEMVRDAIVAGFKNLV